MAMWLTWALAMVLTTGCAGSGTAPNSVLGTGLPDGSATDAEVANCNSDDDCPDDGLYCNGTLVCKEGRCAAQNIPTCNDGVGCTADMCNTETDMCENIPQASACPPGTMCVPGSGCQIAPACEFDSD